MAYNPNIHHRRSIRLKGYDYAQAGVYFITLCTHNREHLFGEVTGGEMKLSSLGEIAYHEWLKTPEIRPNVVLDVFVIMPNHMHGILLITGSPGELHSPPSQPLPTQPYFLPDIPAVDNADKGVCDTPQLKSPSRTIGAILRGYKSAVTKQINLLRGNGQVWQRNYYEHIIRDERAYHNIAEYIINNPLKWEADMFYNK